MGNGKSKREKSKTVSEPNTSSGENQGNSNSNSRNLPSGQASGSGGSTASSGDKASRSHTVSSSNPSSSSSNSGGSANSSVSGRKPDQDGFSLKRLEELFLKYSDDNQRIGIDGMTRFLQDLEVDPEDVVVLVLAWHLNASEMGSFTRDEFIKGFSQTGTDSIPKMKNQLKQMQKELDDPAKFKDIYRYAFHFAKEPDQKVLELQMAEAMLSLILGNDRYPHTQSFLTFLKMQTSYKALNMDQWMSFLEFSRTINQDFTNYDENSAWPVILDEYVDWRNQQKEQENKEEPSTKDGNEN